MDNVCAHAGIAIRCRRQAHVVRGFCNSCEWTRHRLCSLRVSDRTDKGQTVYRLRDLLIQRRCETKFPATCNECFLVEIASGTRPRSAVFAEWYRARTHGREPTNFD